MPNPAIPTTASLSAAKAQVLAQWRRGQAQNLARNGAQPKDATDEPFIPRRLQQNQLPLSYAQQRLW